MNRARPFHRSYWALPSSVIAGCYPGDLDPETMRAKLQGLVDAGVTRVLNLMEAEEVGYNGRKFTPYAEQLQEIGRRAGRQVHCDRFEVQDLQAPSPALMARILDVIHAEIEAGGVVYVHCWGGKGRTAAVIGCYLREAAGMTAEQAFARLMTLTEHARADFGNTPQTLVQSEFIREWQPRKKTNPVRDRFFGSLFGLAVGDAVGTTLEFKSPGSFQPIIDMIGGGPFGLKPGEWTDDTSMALCLAASLVEQRGFDPRDQMERYVRWWEEGYMSVRSTCFDIGVTIASALRRFQKDRDPYAGSTDTYTAGNGSLMRLAPVPLFFFRHPQEAIERSGDSSRTTHAAPAAVDACRYFAGLLIGAIQGAPKEELLSTRFHPTEKLWPRRSLDPAIGTIASGSFKAKHPPEIRGTGYVVASLEAALWAFHTTDDFRTGCLAAANLGEDADTTAAIYGQIAGAHYGLSGIPPEWRERLAKRELIADLAERLYRAAA